MGVGSQGLELECRGARARDVVGSAVAGVVARAGGVGRLHQCVVHRVPGQGEMALLVYTEMTETVNKEIFSA